MTGKEERGFGVTLTHGSQCLMSGIGLNSSSLPSLGVLTIGQSESSFTQEDIYALSLNTSTCKYCDV